MTHGGWKAPLINPGQAVSMVAFIDLSFVTFFTPVVTAWVVSGSEAFDRFAEPLHRGAAGLLLLTG